MSKDEIIKAIETMTVLDLADLIKALEERFGVSAAAPMAVAAAVPAGAAAPAVVEEEQTEFTVVLTEVGANKINVIKEIRSFTNLGLKEAKDLAEAAPTAVKEGVTKAEAQQIKTKLEEAGAKAEVK